MISPADKFRGWLRRWLERPGHREPEPAPTDKSAGVDISDIATEMHNYCRDLHGNAQATAEALKRIDTALLGVRRRALKKIYGDIQIVTNHPVASDSPDHLVPWGTAQDNSRSDRFNARLIALIPDARLTVLDLGCSGGGQVRSFIEQGYFSIGIEGSDYSWKRLRAEWLNIPDFLFTADITKPFKIQKTVADEPLRFGVITLWEVIEHIREEDLPNLLQNIDAHLMPNGLVIMSVSPNSDIIRGTELHQTIRPRDWWEQFFRARNWVNNEKIMHYFCNDLVRWEENAPNSFHFALSRVDEHPVLKLQFANLSRIT
jgi:2-polyprenyl-3-methyl-5-hydroxy-6-metoxy-1,4-benzoquinol methylase